MPTPLSPQTAKLMQDPYGETFKGAPGFMQVLAKMLLPNPQVPLAFGALKAMDPKALELLMGAKEYLPMRIWDFLVKHPDEIKVSTAQNVYGYPYARAVYYPSSESIVGATGNRVQPKDIGHELVHAAQFFIGRGREAFPGLQATEDLMQAYLSKGRPYAHEVLPKYVNEPETSAFVSDVGAALNALESYWPKQ